MNESIADEIPYERQSDPTSNRMCGAAALCMVYRSFGMSASQAELAPKLRGPGASANASARSFLLAQDALARGLSALVLRPRDPFRSLRQNQGQPVRLILNHRLDFESARGHFTVLVQVGEQEVVIHDPQRGANARLLLSDLATLWRPLGSMSEISGNVLVALAQGRTAPTPCPKCSRALPDAIVCPGCRKPFPLHPTAILGCMDASCPERTWEVLFCPYCDTGVVDAPAESLSNLSGTKPAEADDDPLKLKGLSQGIDKFIAVLLKVSNGAPALALQNQITTIRKYQAQMLEFQKKEADEGKAKVAPPPEPAPLPEPPAAKAPPRPPEDWNELGRKLVEEIGRRPI